MIYTITFNPAIDYIMVVDTMKLGGVNRSNYEEVQYGGKGINVSTMLRTLGEDTVALGFVAGFTGKELEEGVKKLGVTTQFISLQEGVTRINIKLKSRVGENALTKESDMEESEIEESEIQESEINGQGPRITPGAVGQLFRQLSQLTSEDLLVLAGSVPKSLPEDIYEQILESVKEKRVKVVVDATKQLLLNTLKYEPFLIKPNIDELGELFGLSKADLEQKGTIIYYAKQLQEMGATHVLISRGKEGAILVGGDGNVYECKAPSGTVKNSVGAGDSMVAGFLYGWMVTTANYEEALKWGIAAGSATAFSDGIGDKNLILRLKEKL